MRMKKCDYLMVCVSLPIRFYIFMLEECWKSENVTTPENEIQFNNIFNSNSWLGTVFIFPLGWSEYCTIWIAKLLYWPLKIPSNYIYICLYLNCIKFLTRYTVFVMKFVHIFSILLRIFPQMLLRLRRSVLKNSVSSIQTW